MEKSCFKCGERKPLEDFYKHPQMSDGRVNKCKECNKRDVRENRNLRHEYYVLYDRNRYTTPKRQALWRAQNEERKTNIEYKEVRKRKNKRYKDKYPEKTRARYLTGKAIHDGVLVRGNCEVCGNDKTQAHHDDYSKPLDVRWLCSEHHGAQHRKSRDTF